MAGHFVVLHDGSLFNYGRVSPSAESPGSNSGPCSFVPKRAMCQVWSRSSGLGYNISVLGSARATLSP